jgi:hypothetical protein
MIFSIHDKNLQLLIWGVPVSDFLTILTFLLLIVTIFISVAALRESSRANTLSSLPVLILKYVTTSAEAKMYVENIGHGSALDIKVDKFYTAYVDNILFPDKAVQVILTSKPIDILRAGESEALDTSGSKVGDFIGEDDIVYNIFNQQDKVTFYIRHSDISGTKYVSKVQVTKNSVDIIGNPKRYTLRQKVIYWGVQVQEWAQRLWAIPKINKLQKQANEKNEAKVNRLNQNK